LFNTCWIKPFSIESLSLNFLGSSKEKLDRGESYSVTIDHLDKVIVKQNFLIEVPRLKFTEKIMSFYNNIKNKLPCLFDEIFEDEQDQIKIYEKFVYLLHLLQMGKIKYQKQTNFLYI
jgi:chromatin segregation and condensation protein Rec8/ScpA/Scc1 (kleisin family)